MREIVLDTETTGFDPTDGHRIVEIGCVEIINQIPTGNTYHQYINPERDMPPEALAVHGLSEEFLKDKPRFSEIVKDFIDFVGTDKMVIHNADFDMNFINYELKQCGFPALPAAQAIDTLKIARRKFPGSPASLDALCRRFEIDNTNRTLHGALLDSELLAEVYLHLLGGRQHGLTLNDQDGKNTSNSVVKAEIKTQKRPIRHFEVSAEELKLHQDMITNDLKDAIWADRA